MDRTDLKILAILQEDASLPVAEIAARVNLSQTPCWRRIQRLEAQGVIERRVALLNPEAVGLGLAVFVEIEAGGHSPEWLGVFSATVAAMPEVMEVYRMAGDIDYLLRVVVGSMAEYDDFYRRLIAEVPLKNVTSRFAMERVKTTTAYPLPQVPGGDGRQLQDRASPSTTAFGGGPPPRTGEELKKAPGAAPGAKDTAST
jgi:Lrp/AsnC family transcriptional regulator, cysteine-sensing transcriptional activator